MAIPLLLSLIVYAVILVIDQGAARRADQAGTERATQASAVLAGEIRRANGVLSGTRLLFAAGVGDAARVASRLEPSLLENAAARALIYSPRVSAAGRRSFEARTGGPVRDYDSGRRAGVRPLYFPAQVVLPDARRQALAGTDSYSVPRFAAAIDRAINTGRTQTVPLSGIAGAEDGYALVQAVYRGRPPGRPSARQQQAAGVVIGAFPLSAIQEALAQSLGAGTGYRLALDGQPVGPPAELGTPSAAEVALAGGRWRVEVARPARDRTPVIVAIVGGAGLVLLISALFAQISRIEREREAAASAAAAASAERDRTSSLIASLQEGVVILGADGRVVSANERFCLMTGADPARIAGRTLAEFLADPTPAEVALLAGQIARGHSSDLDRLLFRAGDEPFPALLSLAPFRDPAGEGAGTVCTVKDISERKRAEDELRASEAAYRGLAVEQGAFRRVATAVAETSDPQAVYSLVSEEAARMLDAQAAWVMRIEGEASVRVLGAYGAELPERISALVGRRIDVEGDWPVAELMRTGHLARRRSGLSDSRPEAYRHSIIAPIRVSGRLWGGLEIARDGAVFPPAADERLARVAELLAIAVSNAESRALLADQASRDPLTDLANHRCFWEHLRAGADQARRYGQPVSLVLLDIDHFKQVNDHHGHQAGDRALMETARRLLALAREGELVARTGGEEFAWILPATDAAGALAAAERAREALAGSPVDAVGRITLSAGVCELGMASDVAELYALADGALYWAKSHGRDQAVLYDPQVVKALSAEERREKAERERVMVGLAGLARAVDARDPATLEHSERVAALAEDLALSLGWAAKDATRLREAALIHDVGKVGIPDAILLKPGRLDDAERLRVREHVHLSTLIAGEVLDAEQTAWVRGHHERWDGSGYPDGLAGEQIPEGARILALADAWDVITADRPYKPSRGAAQALAECRRCAGSHFEPRLVNALAAHLADARGAPS